VHCHQVREYRLLQSFHDKTFSRDDLFVYPLPDNFGVRFDRRHGHKIESVAPDSPAAKAGLRAGDVVTRLDNVPIHSEQDVRWALHRVAAGEQPFVTVERSIAGSAQGQTVRVQIRLSGDWRGTELGWRKSLRSVPLAMGFLAYDLGREERRSGMLPDDRLFIKVVSIRGPGLATNLGLEKGDLITALEGGRHDRSFEDFKSDLLRRYFPGDRVRVTVLRNGAPVDLEGPFPDWLTTDTQVP
jgi:serine protease Do